MSIQADRKTLELIPAVRSRTVVESCAIPLVREPINEAAAAGLAQVFKALGDPVRLRLVSLIGAHQGGQVCVCDLTAAFDLTQPTMPPSEGSARGRPDRQRAPGHLGLLPPR